MSFVEKRSPPRQVHLTSEYTEVALAAERVRSTGRDQMTFDPAAGGWVPAPSMGFSSQPTAIGAHVRSANWTPGEAGNGNRNIRGGYVLPTYATPAPTASVANGMNKYAHGITNKYAHGITVGPWAPPPVQVADMEDSLGRPIVTDAPGANRPRYKGPYARDTNIPLRGGWPVVPSVES